MGRYDKQLKELERAPTLAFGPVGIAPHTLPATEAYWELAEAHDPELRRRLEKLLDRATPAGKVYAAKLLAGLDPAAGRRAWERLAGKPDKISTFSGCIMGQTTLAEYAADQLDAG
jgi:hypothetical protein